MTKLLKNLWARFLFQDRGIVPSGRLLAIFGILSLVLVVVSFGSFSWWPFIVMNIIVVLLSLIDLTFSPKKKDLTFKRLIPFELERNVSYKVQIEVSNRSKHSMFYSIIDGIPQSFQRPFPMKGRMTQGVATIEYETMAPVRGDYEISKLYFRFTSTFRLWEKQLTVDLIDTVKVIPDLSETKQFLENAQKYLLFEGNKIRKYQTGIGDFAQIRNYVVGDDPRKINWRQTAKLRQVMTNEYEPEHGKYITILIDCGRMMGAELTKGNRLEKALEAAHLVAAAALKNGDYVSVLAFAKDVKVFIPAAKGMTHLQTILHSIYNVSVDSAESNYAAVFSFLESMQKKRSLLLLFSDVRTFLYEEHALLYLKRLRQRHLFLMVGIEDATLLSRANETSDNVQQAMIKSIAQQQILFKKKEKIKWERQGLIMLEAKEENVAIAAVSHYIDVMNRNLL
ncbi:DUF58 domain-containing protein [Bacillus sp. FJAT-49711]|uniref:DUF58 domain-containing protein n=1 Tax=Bacillus sp. FJAT-49711 TaxID=2833585 RepID=UPI001BCA1C2E|nr:DUF58 domain-containing protein [Bacillus sp. FJAT-49711]MBS4217575.1 DUF58 domain-containing protein [Bacillus sp. FJAT-49711]